MKGTLVNLGEFLSGEVSEQASEWMWYCELDVTTGSLWAGDPHLANADDGCVVEVPCGKYVVEGAGRSLEDDYRVVSKLRVRLQSALNPSVGDEVGDTGTDSAMIGVCDIRAFDAACAGDSGEGVQDAVESQTETGFGVIDLDQLPGAIMPFVPIGSDGGGPVYSLMTGGECVGIQLEFIEDESDEEGVS
jgi:hypothetical protein